MANLSLLFTATLQDAETSALVTWKWELSDPLHFQFRRPDNGERVRFVPDYRYSCSGHPWNTTVYLGRDWRKRKDAKEIEGLLLSGFFVLGDPELPPPRARRKDRVAEAKSELKVLLERMGK